MKQAVKLEQLQGMASSLLDELSEDSRTFLDLLSRFRDLPEGSEERSELDGELYASTCVLKVHAAGVQKALDALNAALPD